MEQITKQQLILISLLVAIVTAVATSVATVSLNDGTSRPEQTIYRVIEKTIEKVTDIPAVKEIVNTDVKKPVVVTELSPSDIVDQNSDSLVRIYEKVDGVNQFASLGLAVGTKNAIVSSAIATPVVPESRFVAISADGTEIPVKYEKGGLINGFSVFTFEYDPKVKAKVPSLILKDISTIKLGSNVVALGGKESGDVVSTGIITEMKTMSGDAATSTKNILVTDFTPTTAVSGWLLFDTKGNLVAFEGGFGDVNPFPVFMNAKLVEEGMKEFL